MSILNQAAVEALCSATYLENYLETMENLPDDLQRVVSQLRELDIKCRGKHEHMPNYCLSHYSLIWKKDDENFIFIFRLRDCLRIFYHFRQRDSVSS